MARATDTDPRLLYLASKHQCPQFLAGPLVGLLHVTICALLAIFNICDINIKALGECLLLHLL